MKKSTGKRTTASRKSPAPKKALRASPSSPNGNSTGAAKPLVTKQPQSKSDAAVKAGMFLYTDDAWSLAYFDAGDLRCLERELFA